MNRRSKRGRDIQHPRWPKRCRWRTALHESGHVAAYLILANVGSRAWVFRDGRGLTAHKGRPIGFVTMIALCAGDEAARALRHTRPPQGRTRGRGHAPVAVSSVESDIKCLDTIVIDVAPNIDTAKAVESIREQAAHFVKANRALIGWLAESLYLRGRIDVHAPKRETAG